MGRCGGAHLFNEGGDLPRFQALPTLGLDPDAAFRQPSQPTRGADAPRGFDLLNPGAHARDRIAACKRKQEEIEAAGRQEEEALISALEVELRALRATDPGMSLLTAVEYVTSDPGARIVLYRRCNAENRSVECSGTGQDDPGLLTIAWSVAKDLALLERRARSEGFQT
jgi:hypothetical protein